MLEYCYQIKKNIIAKYNTLKKPYYAYYHNKYKQEEAYSKYQNIKYYIGKHF